MNQRKLYGDTILVNQIISEFTLSNELADGSVEYIDNGTKEIWLKYEVSSMYLGETIINLVRLPEPSNSELIDILFSSDFEDEVIAAALKIRDNELYKGQEFREELLSEIVKIDLKKLDRGQKERLKRIILLTELSHGENRRDIIGKKSKEIENDFNFFMKIAVKTEEILNKLN